jgi:hypothetical protein
MPSPRFVRPNGVAVVADEPREGPVTYLARLPDGPIVVLEGTASIIWGQAVGGEVPDVASGVAAATGEEVTQIRDAVDQFLADLVDAGLLLRLPHAAGPGETP